MNYNNVINWFFLPFLIVVLMLRTDGAKASHMWCGWLNIRVPITERGSIYLIWGAHQMSKSI